MHHANSCLPSPPKFPASAPPGHNPRPLRRLLSGAALGAGSLLLLACPPNIIITEPMRTLTLSEGPLPPLGQTSPGRPGQVAGSSIDTEGPAPGVGEESDAPCALVLLPGGFDRPSRFAREDFAGIVTARHPGLEIVVADAHLRYWLRGIALDRLRDEVIGPLRERGYRVWLAGISLGGMGTLFYGMEHGEGSRAPIEGMVTLAPFLGQDDLIEDIASAGGALEWSARRAGTEADAGSPSTRRAPRRPGRDTVGYDLWPWLARRHERQAAGEAVPALTLAYGRADDFAPAGELLAPLLDENRVFTHPGGHEWSAWTPLWRDIVAAGTFDSCPSP